MQNRTKKREMTPNPGAQIQTPNISGGVFQSIKITSVIFLFFMNINEDHCVY